MIQRLHIKNYAIIEELDIDFSEKLTVITGETGAGKSILLGALGLIMGKRGDTKVLYHKDAKCIVEGTFAVAKYKIQDFFEKNDIDYDDEVVIRREFTPSGKSRAFINDTPANLKLLQELTGVLIDLHQQFDTLDIHNVSFQLRMLDALAGNEKMLNGYQKLHRAYQANKRELKKLIEYNDTAAREMDFLNFQMQEFNDAALMPGEQKEMEVEINRLTNAEGIKKTLSAAFQNLSESENSILSQMETLSIELNQVRKIHPKLTTSIERYESILLELNDLAKEFEDIADDTEYDELRIKETQERLDLIYKLQQKHRVKTLDELLTIHEELSIKLTGFNDLTSGIDKLEKQLVKEEKELHKIADDLSKRRKKVVSGFEKKIHALLGQLSMEHAKIKIEVKPLEDLTPTGTDLVNFLFAPNKGSEFLPIKDVASGGELSRLVLCTKSLVADAIPLPTLIFDEIDTGISGDVAMKMGTILQELSNRHQVVTITHTAQIAVKADCHYFVFKLDREERTVTKVKQLTPDERVRAVATMLSGSPPSESAMANARELLEFPKIV